MDDELVAWIESHQDLGDHPKTKKLARLLGASRPAVVGHLHYLWWWAVRHAQDGDLTPYDAATIADEAKWDGDPEAFVQAMLDCGPEGKAGFLEVVEGRTLIHDWWEYAGKLIEARKKDAERKREARHSHAPDDLPPSGGRPKDVRAPSDVTVPYRTQQHTTAPNQGDGAPAPVLTLMPAGRRANSAYSPDFECFWSTYPLKRGKEAAWQQWLKLLRDGSKPDELTAAAGYYAEECEQLGKADEFILHGSTFLGPKRRYRDYVDGVPAARGPTGKGLVRVNGHDVPQSMARLKAMRDREDAQEAG